MKTVKYARKPFYVDVPDPVSEENMAEMAEWCKGEIRTEGSGPNARKYIKVHVHLPLKERQTKAFIGDRILFAGNGFKVYTPKAFENSFNKVKHLSRAEADAAGIHWPIEPKRKGVPKNIKPKPKPVVEATPELAERINREELVVDDALLDRLDGEMSADEILQELNTPDV